MNEISKLFISGKKHVVPISGGLDSRAILASLLKFTEAANIYTYTFGTPSTFDYEIGNLIAKETGTMHTSFPLNDYIFSNNGEINFSQMSDSQTILFHHPPIEELFNKFEDHNIWSGFLGDPLAGAHLTKSLNDDINNAKKNFLIKNRFVKSVNLLNISEATFLVYLTPELNIDKSDLTFEEQLDFGIRQNKYIAPHVCFSGLKYITPFTSSRWVNFILSQKIEYRANRKLFKDMFLNNHPDLFSLPAKETYGLPLSASLKRIKLKKGVARIKNIWSRLPHPNINYLDFNKGIRDRADLKKIVYDNIMDLKDRELVPWVDIDSIWRSHQNKNSDHADALLTLASLELHIKAGKVLQ